MQIKSRIQRQTFLIMFCMPVPVLRVSEPSSFFEGGGGSLVIFFPSTAPEDIVFILFFRTVKEMSYILYIYIYKYPGSWRLRLQPNTLAPGGSGFETLPVLVCSTVNVNLTLFLQATPQLYRRQQRYPYCPVPSHQQDRQRAAPG